ncbi:hypothetical protein D8Y23_08140 [Microbacterium enclense]|uniref:Uncharacterized protein n=1 Tax=Microbacterium enclense TaxID=993073 RepID=A0A443JFK3_9MICO|nr:hypothetical protein D8Y23_08140 [Microbacterium enclense]
MSERAGRGIDRRTVLRGAAWSVPVVTLAVAAPSAAASVNNADLQLTGLDANLLSIQVLDSPTVATAAVALTVPTQLAVVNGAGALTGSATVSIRVGRPSGIALTLGRARGFGVHRFDGATTTSGQRTTVYETNALGSQIGFPVTTFTTTTNLNVASGQTLNIPLVWGLAGSRSGVAVNALATFPVTATVTVGGRTLSAASSIIVPLNAGVL